MSAPTHTNKIQVASVSDRGLNEKRPLNEDSFLADAERGIFVVADGVGGAEAGEVASQKAVEVLDEAFRHKLNDGDDAEDLMELAIQRANSSIHQMAVEHPRFSSMATTVVALHVDGNRATFGHVGDSRLYRLGSDGKLSRETEDHSIVEEEVRAGRMTPEQAANHPSKNVISRALGAEDSVEVDMNTTEVEDGTTFLLCTDGITRHIPDNELRGLLAQGQNPQATCEEMKRRCYERGAEDNLTAVIVQVGTPKYDSSSIDEERTVDARLESVPAAPPVGSETRLTPPSRIAFPGPTSPQQALASSSANAARSSSGKGRSAFRFFVFLLFIAAVGAAFYGGMFYQRSRSAQEAATSSANQLAQEAERANTFERKRAAVDSDPQKWLAENGAAKATDSKDPEFLYLYGRALMLSGNHREAMQAFDLALNNLRAEPKANLSLGAELKLAEASAALKLKNQSPGARSQESLMAEQKAAAILDELLGMKSAVSTK
ncbi:MAG TPA: PP2C family serine/threonine-protein phosphatase [Pyrinomonadaceae bacterium]|nr:PP2C family serine/threonine-protein phosphatase [Pyrinomonadaceae bacterium]